MFSVSKARHACMLAFPKDPSIFQVAGDRGGVGTTGFLFVAKQAVDFPQVLASKYYYCHTVKVARYGLVCQQKARKSSDLT